MSQFKKGDRVVDVSYGEGVVIKVDPIEDPERPVVVLFDDVIGKRESDEASYINFTLDGRNHALGSGYKWKSKFYEYHYDITLQKIK